VSVPFLGFLRQRFSQQPGSQQAPRQTANAWTNPAGRDTLDDNPTQQNPASVVAQRGSGPLSPNTGIAGGRRPGLPNVNLDPQYLRQQAAASYRKRGWEATPEELDYAVSKASHPETFSDGKTRIGWNGYWDARFSTPGSASADPRLAGEEGVLPGFAAQSHANPLAALFNNPSHLPGFVALPSQMSAVPTAAQGLQQTQLTIDDLLRELAQPSAPAGLSAIQQALFPRRG